MKPLGTDRPPAYPSPMTSPKRRRAKKRGRAGKRLRGMVARIVTVGLILLFVGTIIWWVESYWRTDRVAGGWGRHSLKITSCRGGMTLALHTHDWDSISWEWIGFTDDELRYPWRSSKPSEPPWWQGLIRFRAGSEETGDESRIFLMFPHWMAAILFGVTPAMMFVRRRAARGRLGTACSKCGYDLRATPARCPECGAVAGE